MATPEMKGPGTGPSPERIIQMGLGFMGAKTLLSAVELGVFTKLGGHPMEGSELSAQLGLHQRSARDFLDALVALGLLERHGQVYSNTPETEFFLDRSKPSYIGGLLEMVNARLYTFWGSLTDGLKTGKPQNEAKTQGADFTFESFYSDPERMRGFLQAMTGLSLNSARAISAKFPWQRYKTFADVGGAQGGVAVEVAKAHPHLNGLVFDLPPVKPHCEEYLERFDLNGRVRFVMGNFFKDALPQVDVIIMGHVLHDWGLPEKRLLISKAYQALPPGGAFLALDSIIDDERRKNVPGLLMSLNMLIETSGGFDYCAAEGCAWMRDAGFREAHVEHLAGQDSMVVAIK
jgi:SAM-dependent methyltransferase